MICPTDESLSLLLQEQHDEATTSQIVTHVEQCKSCETKLESLSLDGLPEFAVNETLLPAKASAMLNRVLHHLKCPDETLAGNHAATDVGDDEEFHVVQPNSDADDDEEFTVGQSSIFPDPPRREESIGAIGRYEVLREIGRGGMGVLYEGIDTKNQQPVALKVMHGWLMDRPEAIERMQREADSAIRVRHPGVLAVFEFLKPKNMPPVLVLELLSGRTLTDLLSERGKDVTDVKPELRMLVEAIRGLAALNKAGIIHRDIKPSNLLIDNEEEPGSKRLVVGDFGLVRDEEAGSDLTRTQNLLGTPAYMSPEQIARPNAVDARSDVYSMGCVIYQTLTGVAPFEGSLRMILWQATHADVRPPRQLNDAVDRDVETICLKALSKRPEERYQTSDALADDLERYLSGKSIQAKPPGPIKKLVHWSRKHPTTAVAAAALAFILLASTITSIIVAQTLSAAKARETRAKEIAVENEAAAKEQSQLAFETLTSVIQDVQTGLAEVAGGSQVRQRILKTSLDKLDGVSTKFLAQASVDHQTIWALMQMGDVVKQLGSSPDAPGQGQSKPDQNKPDQNKPEQNSAVRLAEQYFKRANTLAGDLAKSNPDDGEAQRDLSVSFNRLGDIQLLSNDVVAATNSYQRGCEIAKRLAIATPDDASLQSDLSESLVKLGGAKLVAGDPARAIELFQDSLKVAEKLTAAEPDNPQWLRKTSIAYTRLGLVQLQSGKVSAAKTSYGNALDIDVKLAAASPNNTTAQRDLAISHSRIGDIHLRSSDGAAALKSYHRGLAIRKTLADAEPENSSSQRQLAASHEEIGSLQRQMGQPKAALASFQISLKIVEPLYQADQENLQLKGDVAQLWARLATAQHESGDSEEAIESYQTSLDLRLALCKQDPENAASQRELSVIHDGLAQLHLQSGNTDAALSANESSLAIAIRLANASPDDARAQRDLVVTWYQLATTRRVSGDYSESAEAFDSSVKVLAEMIRRNQMVDFARAAKADMQNMAKQMRKAASDPQ